MTRTRARPLPTDERRAAIVAAATPLVREQGRAVTTREIAQAADVAEGTLFRAFGDKESLIDAVVEHEFTLDRTHDAIRAIDPRDPLPERVAAVVTVLRERLQSMFALMIALRMKRPPEHRHDAYGGPYHQVTLQLITDVLAPDATALRYPPERCATLIRLLAFAASHPAITDGAPLSAAEIADVVLHGVTTSSATCARTHPGASPC